jgi:hypothetical protein
MRFDGQRQCDVCERAHGNNRDLMRVGMHLCNEKVRRVVIERPRVRDAFHQGRNEIWIMAS